MKIKRFTVEDVYFNMMKEEFKENKVKSEESMFIYFASYYINRFLHTDLKIKSYIGLKVKGQTKDVFCITIPFSTINESKENKRFFKKYFEECIKDNERYVGLLKLNKEQKIGFLFKHDEELLNAYKTGQYSKISESKKKRMKRLKVIDYDMKVKAFYVYLSNHQEPNPDEWKEYPLGKSDKILFELYKMIYPEYFYNVLAEQFNINIEYLKKNQVQILPKPNFENEYLEISENDELYWFDKKQ